MKAERKRRGNADLPRLLIPRHHAEEDSQQAIADVRKFLWHCSLLDAPFLRA